MNNPFPLLPENAGDRFDHNLVLKMLLDADYATNDIEPAGHEGMTISSHSGMSLIDSHEPGATLANALNRIDPGPPVHTVSAMIRDFDLNLSNLYELLPYLELEKVKRFIPLIQNLLNQAQLRVVGR